MIKLHSILFRKSENFSESDKQIKAHFLYAGEEYLFCYYNEDCIKNILILNENSGEIIYKNYTNIKENTRDSKFAKIFDESFLQSLKNSKLCKFFDFEFIDLVRFYDDWN